MKTRYGILYAEDDNCIFSPNVACFLLDFQVPMTMGETQESATKKNRRVGGGEQGEEDVDIGEEELPSGSFPPVEIEKDTPGAGYESSSSDSSSDSSSSSSSSGVCVNCD